MIFNTFKTYCGQDQMYFGNLISKKHIGNFMNPTQYVTDALFTGLGAKLFTNISPLTAVVYSVTSDLAYNLADTLAEGIFASTPQGNLAKTTLVIGVSLLAGTFAANVYTNKFSENTLSNVDGVKLAVARTGAIFASAFALVGFVTALNIPLNIVGFKIVKM